MSRIVVALGGNALGTTAEEQREKVKHAAKALAPLILEGNSVIITHGNGPQVGMINLAFDTAFKCGKTPEMPFPECAAMSQGYIGYHLQQAIDAELVANGRDDIPVITMLTQVIVDKNDPAFKNPTKPIGGYYTEQEAKQLAKETGYAYAEDSGRGWRRVVASPKPIGIYETMTLKALMDAKQVIIAGGGGGIPVIKDKFGYKGISAVIDKDFAAAKIAELVEADNMFILTAVSKVAVNYGKPNQKDLDYMKVDDAERYIREGQFAKGSMLPKVEAAISFAKTGKVTVIAALDEAAEALKGNAGTAIYM